MLLLLLLREIAHVTKRRSKPEKFEGVLRSVDAPVYQLVGRIRSEELYLRVKNPDIVLTECGHFNRNEMWSYSP